MSPDIETLEWVSWGMQHFSGLAAGNLRSELEALEKLGLVKCEGTHPVCDDDGFLKDPEEYDDLYVLTPEGRSVLNADNARREKAWEASLQPGELRHPAFGGLCISAGQNQKSSGSL